MLQDAVEKYETKSKETKQSYVITVIHLHLWNMTEISSWHSFFLSLPRRRVVNITQKLKWDDDKILQV